MSLYHCENHVEKRLSPMRDSHLHLLLVLATPEMLTHIRIKSHPTPPPPQPPVAAKRPKDYLTFFCYPISIQLRACSQNSISKNTQCLRILTLVGYCDPPHHHYIRNAYACTHTHTPTNAKNEGEQPAAAAADEGKKKSSAHVKAKRVTCTFALQCPPPSPKRVLVHADTRVHFRMVPVADTSVQARREGVE